ncbi:hypothetical protein R3P38DRAFT_3235540 [Favolaschia claudopus]|uniref:Uncharacterized protein n=1 Tax=Favolaschia claudopus TaxID=2862362 RepID=A0AAV9ZDP1_9AGAR
MAHIGDPPKKRSTVISSQSIIGFRTPSSTTLKLLAAADFTYDSATAADIPITESGTDPPSGLAPPTTA